MWHNSSAANITENGNNCSSIYSWHGSYWQAEGCTLLGNPCGAAGECPSSVANVCQNVTSSSPSPSPSPRHHRKNPCDCWSGRCCSCRHRFAARNVLLY